MLSFLRDLLAHAEWANAVFFHVWGKSPARDHEELRRRVDHLIGVQQELLALVCGEPSVAPRDGPPGTFAELKERAERCHARLREFSATLAPESLSARVRIPFFPDPPCIITTGETIVQIAMHTQHHRGQCMTRLRDFGGEPKNVDWIVWLWRQKPAARWSSE